jgi:uncharacterized protein YkwD
MRLFLAVLVALATAAPAGAFSVPSRHRPHDPRHHHVRPLPAKPAPPQATPASSTVADDEQLLLDAVNAARAAGGLPALAVDAALEDAARAHTQNLLANDAFTHDFLDATGPAPFASRIRRFYQGSCGGENLASGTPSLTPERAVQLWLNSPGHRANMLSTRFTTIGVALQSRDGTWIATTDFGGC